MADVLLEAKKRNLGTKRTIHNLRRDGYIPGVLYGRKTENQYLMIPEQEMIKLLNSHGTGGLISLKVDGEAKKVLIREMQKHPTTGQLVHIDFLNVKMNEIIKSNITLIFKGEPKGNAILQAVIRNVEVEAYPSDMPEFLEIDASELVVDDRILVADLQKLTKAKIITDPETLVASVTIPKATTEVSPEGAVTPLDEAQKVPAGATV